MNLKALLMEAGWQVETDQDRTEFWSKNQGRIEILPDGTVNGSIEEEIDGVNDAVKLVQYVG